MKDFDAQHQQLVDSLVGLTKACQFVKPADWSFLRSDEQIATNLDKSSDLILGLFNQTFQYCNDDLVEYQNSNDFIYNFQPVLDVVDNLLEKADVCIHKIIGRTIQLVPKLPEDAPVSNIIKAGGQLRPQAKFRDKIDNSNTPFVPKLSFKPNSLTEFQPYLNTSQTDYPHPYEYEIANITYPESVFQCKPHIKSKEMSNTILKFIDTTPDLEYMCEIIESCSEIAVDLEHHDYRSYQGLTCLIQISTREEDFLVDALELRHELYRLNVSFTNPNILKVFHGADRDVLWLQRDFGVYIVGMFDTFQASKLLGLEAHSLAFLLKYFCNVITDKKYQRADWRIRPLPSDMTLYARTDTHYLLYIYDQMKTQLLERSDPEINNLMVACLSNSAQVTLKKYTKEIYDALGGRGSMGWLNTKFREYLPAENVLVYRALHGWRDHIARNEDESLRYVLPDHMLFGISRALPLTLQDVIGCCSPTPHFVRLYAADIACLIENTVKEFKMRSESDIQSQALEPQKANDTSAVSATNVSQFVMGEKKITNTVTVTVSKFSSFFAKAEKKELTSSELKALEIKAGLSFVAPSYLTLQEKQKTADRTVVSKPQNAQASASLVNDGFEETIKFSDNELDYSSVDEALAEMAAKPDKKKKAKYKDELIVQQAYSPTKKTKRERKIVSDDFHFMPHVFENEQFAKVYTRIM
jgi:exosome complex exonuclease RRP6